MDALNRNSLSNRVQEFLKNNGREKSVKENSSSFTGKKINSKTLSLRFGKVHIEYKEEESEELHDKDSSRKEIEQEATSLQMTEEQKMQELYQEIKDLSINQRKLFKAYGIEIPKSRIDLLG